MKKEFVSFEEERKRAIKGWIALSGRTVGGLAKELGVSKTFMSYFIHGRRKSRPLEKALIRMGFPKSKFQEDNNANSC